VLPPAAIPLLTTAAPPDAAGRGLALLVMVALLGVVLVGCAGLLVLMGSRRRRLRALGSGERTKAPAVDPWAESARRLQADDDGDDQG